VVNLLVDTAISPHSIVIAVTSPKAPHRIVWIHGFKGWRITVSKVGDVKWSALYHKEKRRVV
jgi:hypothetical protein